MKENPKYRSIDSPPFVEPVIDWPPSMTDPSQNISTERLIQDHINRTTPPPPMYYGTDLSRVDFTAAHSALRDLQVLQDQEKARADADKKKADADKQAAAERELLDVVGQLSSPDLKPGSPGIQALAAKLTGILPGFKAAVIAPSEGDSKA